MTVLMLAAAMVLTTGVLSAAPLVTETSTLEFGLSDETILLGNAVPSDSSYWVAEVEFQMAFDTTLAFDIGVVEFQIEYDTTMLHFIDIALSDTGWTSDVSLTVANDTTGTLSVTLEQLSLSTPLSTPTTLASIRFSALCQPELNVNDIVFTGGASENRVFAGDRLYTPSTGGFEDGSVTIGAYVVQYWFGHDTLVGGMSSMDYFNVPIYANTNVNTRTAAIVMAYDTSKVVLVGVDTSGCNWDALSVSPVDVGAWELKFTSFSATHDPDTSEIIGTAILHQKCGLGHGTTVIELYDSTYWEGKNTCEYVFPRDPDSLASGSVTNIEAATLSTSFGGQKVSATDLVDQPVSCSLFVSNTFATGRSSIYDDNGIVININSTPYLDYQGDSGGIAFEAEGGGVYWEKLCLFQPDTTSGVWLSSSTPVHRHTIDFDFESNGLTPTWEDRWIYPFFADSFSHSNARTMLPDLNDCVTADSASGLLDLSEFDSLEVYVAEYYTTDLLYGNACPKQYVYLRDNFEADSVALRINVSPNYNIDVTYLRSGIVDSVVNDWTILIWSTSSFAPISSMGGVYLCQVQYTADSYCGQSYCNVGLNFSDGYARRTGEDFSEFCDLDPGTTRLQYYSLCPRWEFKDGSDTPEPEAGLPLTFALHQNYPNPFNPATTISLDLPSAVFWKITVYNIAGQAIKEFEGTDGPGTVSVTWDASNYASGVYLYRAVAGESTASKKMLLIK